MGKGKSIVDVGLAQARRPLSPRSHYFELEILDPGEKCYIALGVARKVRGGLGIGGLGGLGSVETPPELVGGREVGDVGQKWKSGSYRESKEGLEPPPGLGRWGWGSYLGYGGAGLKDEGCQK